MPPITNPDKNKLYYGDNLEVLRDYIPDQSVDLIYLDPPFNSRQDYNVLFAEKDGTRSASQITAFKDTWEWNEEAARSYEEVIEQGGRVADATRANHKEELKDKNWTSTQTVENAFSLFKRGIVGNYHQLSREHLDRYLGEFCWRYNRRKMQPWLFEMTLTNLVNKKPLPYKDLTF
jgi:hypothetical protein